MSHKHCCHENHDSCHSHGCPCCEGTCGHHHHHHEHEHHDNFSKQLIQMADDAWMELLKEKIKEQIQSTSKDHLDQLAKLVAESNHERWKHKMQTLKATHDYRDKLEAFFNR